MPGILRTFSGDYFSVDVVHAELPRLRLSLVHNPGSSASQPFPSSLDTWQAWELARLLRQASALADFIGNGGTLEVWDSRPWFIPQSKYDGS